jgi:hypothetical protein
MSKFREHAPSPAQHSPYAAAQLRPLILAQRPVTLTAAAPVQHHPVAQGALVDAQLPGHLRDRPARLPDNPDRALLEVLIEPPP